MKKIAAPDANAAPADTDAACLEDDPFGSAALLAIDKNLISPNRDEQQMIQMMAGLALPQAPTARRITPMFAGYEMPQDAGQEAWLSQFPLRARGRNLTTRKGERFKLSAINWCKFIREMLATSLSWPYLRRLRCFLGGAMHTACLRG